MTIIELLKIIACPVCKGDLHSDNDVTHLLCSTCGLSFQIKEGIPVLMIDEAVKIGDQGPGTGNQNPKTRDQGPDTSDRKPGTWHQ